MSSEFVVLKIDTDYEISTSFPHIIRRCSNKYCVKPKNNGGEYYQVVLNGKYLYVHRIIAMQFIENDDPEHKTQVDHINRIRDDNRIENLRWVTPSTNNCNKTSRNGVKYVYLDKLPDNCDRVCEYRNKHFDNVYYCRDNGNMYSVCDNIVKQLNIKERILKKGTKKHVFVRDVNNKYIRVDLDAVAKDYV